MKLKLTGVMRVWALTTCITITTSALYLVFIKDLPALFTKPRIPLWLLVVMFGAAEIFVVHLQFRRDAHSISLSEIPLVLGLLFAAPTELIIAQLIGSVMALAMYRRQSLLKLSFNVSHFCLEAAIATLVLRAFHQGSTIDPLTWMGSASAALTASSLGMVLVFGAISLSEGRLQLEGFPEAMKLGVIASITNCSFALLASTVAMLHLGASLLLIIPAATIFIAYRAYSAKREQHESLRFLLESTQVIQQATDVEAATLALLDQARKMFRAEIAQIQFLPSIDNDSLLRTTLGPGDHVSLMESVERDPRAVISAQLGLSGGKPVLLPRPIVAHSGLEAEFGFLPVDAMVTPVWGDTRIIGTLLVANRLGDVSTFDDEDLKLFQTLANHGSISLRNGRLEKSLISLNEAKEELKHQAFHDPLTGLANRALFSDRVGLALARASRHNAPVAVLFLDLDDFKTVNDSLGHDAGDDVLKAVSQRLLAQLRPSDTAARLGGDEFAILLDSASTDHAKQVAERIIESVSAPIGLSDSVVVVHASLGIAISGGEVMCSELLRNADVAMYMAKSTGKGRYRMFEPQMQERVVTRLILKEELRLGVERCEFEAFYQPTFDLDSGRVAGVEALVRWNHPTRGMVLPGEFIGLAEETRLILPIGRWMLTEACQQVAAWQSQFPENSSMTVSVNLSAEQIRRAGFVEEVKMALSNTGLDPASLILEITESLLMHNSEDTIAALQDLRSIGVRLAIDDFGTGYSSFSYLKDFPVDILKIDKSFVSCVADGPGEDPVIRAIIELSRALKLVSVAEGIESIDQMLELKKLRCQYGQGFLFSVPTRPKELEDLLGRPSPIGSEAEVAGAA